MPNYNSNVSTFKKWLPVKAWMQKQKFSAPAPYSVPATCDQINRSVNSQFVYQRDGLNDIWFTPDQFIKFHGGDCEDFSIYKMSKLAAAGVKLANMEMVICTDKQSREYHAVLRVFSGNYQYVLDNQSVTLWTKETYNARYAPIYAIGMSGWRICST